MRQHAGKMRAGRIRPLGQIAEPGTGQLGDARGQGAHAGSDAMPPRRCPAGQATACVFSDAAMRSLRRAGLIALAQFATAARQVPGLAPRRPPRRRPAMVDQAIAREIVRNIEEILVLAAVCKADLRAVAAPPCAGGAQGSALRARTFEPTTRTAPCSSMSAIRSPATDTPDHCPGPRSRGAHAVIDIGRAEMRRRAAPADGLLRRSLRRRCEQAGLAGIRFAQVLRGGSPARLPSRGRATRRFR